MPRSGIVKASQSRVFITRGGPGPSNPPIFLNFGAAGAATQPGGARTPVFVPDPTRYDSFVQVDEVRGQPAMPTLMLDARLQYELSLLLDLTQKGCEFQVHVHHGACEDPSDFDQGYSLADIFEHASSTDWKVDSLGALDASKNAPVGENISIAARRLIQIKPMVAQSFGDATVTDEIVDIAICDSVSCGDCGPVSDGTQHVYSLQRAPQGSPGLPAKVIYTADGGATFGTSVISSLGLGENPTAILCSGPYLVVVSGGASCAIHYTKTADLLHGIATWTKTSVGFVAAGCPTKGFSQGRTKNWFVGIGGYIYFTNDPTGSVVVQSSGGQTTQNLNQIDGADAQNLVAVGNSNAVLVTNDGGTTWAAITGPAVGVNLNAISVETPLKWFIGTQGGRVYFTEDGGFTWTEKVFSQSGNCSVRDINFASESGGFMIVNITGSNRGTLYRTINGGFSWTPVPENVSLAFPVNGGLNSLGITADPNVVWVGGIATAAGTDGILIKSSGKPAAWG